MFANIIQEAFSPLINLFESVMVFIHAHLVGGSWGLAIVGLTVLTRAVLVPLTFKQLRSMQEMQRMAPEINKLKEKYKDDKQRQQQEIMKFYQENKINPLASCLPFLLQLPVFISLFYMLRTDLKFDICGPQLREYYSRELHRPIVKNSQIPEHAVKVMGHTVKGLTEVGCNVVAPGSAKFLFIPDITYKATGAVLIVLIAVYIASQIASTLMATASADPNQRRMMLLLPLVIVAFLFRYPAGLLVYWITTNVWTIGQQYFIRQRMGPPPAEASEGRRRIVQRTGEGVAEGRAGRRHGGGNRQRCQPATSPPQEEEALGQAAMSASEHDGGVEDDEPAALLEDLLAEIADGLDLDVEIDVQEDDGLLKGTLRGEDVGLFIGRRGQTIDAVQHLAQRIVFHEGPSDVRIVIDADGYRERRAEMLRADADDAAEETLRTGRPVEMDPMPASERRVVHEHLRDRGDVETHSEGDEPERRLVVSPLSA